MSQNLMFDRLTQCPHCGGRNGVCVRPCLGHPDDRPHLLARKAAAGRCDICGHSEGHHALCPKEDISRADATKATNPKDAVGVRKAPMSTVPANVLAEVGVGMLEGTCKYGRHNYRAMGVRSSVYYDGTMRHLMSWWEGEDIDPDSTLSHITKAICSLVVLRDAMMRGMVTDDRPPRSALFYPDLNARAAGLIDKYVEMSPHHYTLADNLGQAT